MGNAGSVVVMRSEKRGASVSFVAHAGFTGVGVFAVEASK
jgi:hypothetical protein